MVSGALTVRRSGPLLAALIALTLGIAPAHAQSGSADGAPYPAEDATPAEAVPEKTKPAKPPAPKQAAAPPAIPLPQARPDASRTAAAAPAPATIDLVMPKPRPEVLKTPAASELAALAPAPDAVVLPDAVPVNPAKEGDTLYGNAADERLLIQAALLWSGDYTGAAENGDDPLQTAVKNFQKRKNRKVTGTLTNEERAELVSAAKNYQNEFGWSVVADPATGIRIGLPTKMMPIAREAARGTHWSSRYGDVQVETFRIVEPSLKLSALFEREKQEPSTRKIDYSLLRDDGFFISGLQGLKKFSVRAQLRNGEVRGFTMLYDQAMETIVAPVMVAMASAFSPFPQRTAPFAALTKSVDYGNGITVSAQGHIVTDARLVQNCQVILANGFGDAERIAEDKERGLALLRVYGPRKFSPLALPRGAAVAKGDVTLAGIPDPKESGGTAKLTEIKAKLTDGNAIEMRDAVPMAGLAGAAAIDASGRFLGLTEMRNAVLASIQPSVPPVRLIRADAIRKFLDTQHVQVADTAATNPRDAVVRIICVRK